MATWNGLTLKIRVGTYRPPRADAGLWTGKLIPPTTGTDHAEVIQQGARERKRLSFQGIADSLSDYDTLHDAWIAQDTDDFTGPAVTSFRCRIWSLSPPEYFGLATDEGVFYDIVFIEETGGP